MSIQRSMILTDSLGVINDALKKMPKTLWGCLAETLSELEDRDCFIHKSWPKTHLEVVESTCESIYRARIGNGNPWRLHVQYGGKNEIVLKDVLPPEKHDRVQASIAAKKTRYR